MDERKKVSNHQPIQSGQVNDPRKTKSWAAHTGHNCPTQTINKPHFRLKSQPDR